MYSGLSPINKSASLFSVAPCALGLNTRDILAATADKHGGVVDVSSMLDAPLPDEQPGRIARVLEGVFHTDVGAEDADLDDNDGWLDLGPEDLTGKIGSHRKALGSPR